jgi:NitT/TauT family transport system substrate-binding protein
MLNRKRYLALGAAALAGATLVPRAARAADTVRVGMLKLPNALFAGLDQGFFDAEGIAVDPVFFEHAADLVPAVATGQIEVAMVSPGAALFNALALGINATIVADYWTAARAAPSGDSAYIVVRKDIAPYGTFKPAESRGLTFAVTERGQMTELFANNYLASVHVNKDDVNMIDMPLPDMPAALKNHAVDIAATIDPYATLVVGQELAVKIVGLSELMPGYVLGVLIYGQSLAKSNRGIGTRFMRAFSKSNLYLRAQLATPAGRAAIGRLYQKYVPIADPTLYQKIGLAVGPENLSVQAEGRFGLIWEMDQYANAGLVQQRPNVMKSIDNSFAEAVARSK